MPLRPCSVCSSDIRPRRHPLPRTTRRTQSRSSARGPPLRRAVLATEECRATPPCPRASATVRPGSRARFRRCSSHARCAKPSSRTESVSKSMWTELTGRTAGMQVRWQTATRFNLTWCRRQKNGRLSSGLRPRNSSPRRIQRTRRTAAAPLQSSRTQCSGPPPSSDARNIYLTRITTQRGVGRCARRVTGRAAPRSQTCAQYRDSKHGAWTRRPTSSCPFGRGLSKPVSSAQCSIGPSPCTANT